MPTNPHSAPPTPAPLPPQFKKPTTDYNTLFYKTAWKRYQGNNLMLMNLQGAEPTSTAVDHLPGGTPEDKVTYLLDYLDEGFKQGLTAWDIIKNSHDTGLGKARPVTKPGTPAIKDPRAALRYSFKSSIGGDSYAMTLLKKGLNEYMTVDVPGNYKAFWTPYMS
jgi:hypothetical protein